MAEAGTRGGSLDLKPSRGSLSRNSTVQNETSCRSNYSGVRIDALPPLWCSFKKVKPEMTLKLAPRYEKLTDSRN
jgi:hypothetical protein